MAPVEGGRRSTCFHLSCPLSSGMGDTVISWDATSGASPGRHTHNLPLKSQCVIRPLSRRLWPIASNNPSLVLAHDSYLCKHFHGGGIKVRQVFLTTHYTVCSIVLIEARKLKSERETYTFVSTRPFPTKRDSSPDFLDAPSGNFVGSNGGSIDLSSFRQCPEKCRPEGHKDWLLC